MRRKLKLLNSFHIKNLVYCIVISVLINLNVKTCDAVYNVIDVDDILSAEFMPGSLLMLENPEESVKILTNSSHDYHLHPESRGDNTTLSKHASVGTDGGIMDALNTMVFHRFVLDISN